MAYIFTVYTRISAAICKQCCGAYLNTDFFFLKFWPVNMKKAVLLAGRIAISPAGSEEQINSFQQHRKALENALKPSKFSFSVYVVNGSFSEKYSLATPAGVD